MKSEGVRPKPDHMQSQMSQANTGEYSTDSPRDTILQPTVPLAAINPLSQPEALESLLFVQGFHRANIELADRYIQKAIQCHEKNELEKAAHLFRLAACQGSPIGLFLYGISLRHGWGCKESPIVAFQCLQKAAECAVFDLNHITQNTNLCVAREELVLAIHELGVSFQNGWGVSKNKATAAYYFEIAANLGDPDAQNDLAFCYLHGHGVKKDRFKAAKYYRMAHAQGMGVVGNSWIFKEKYDQIK
ncbi:HCP-like protein [Basidiobolus meristosporus CBS 931.73]|uniref:HCP-like protein n=1 Tax=Basidiobolus meristosporus CBS 931.73 TaxID=1314790 RepID=A0A1Y1Y240_9FUNG|nr:HCP-like protein [Basidiobolus meristosporus CBS 931.73]|eukprot:ORX92072.1 HCP-like protein [Basidiobolus meristosporus CBS 931.73]